MFSKPVASVNPLSLKNCAPARLRVWLVLGKSQHQNSLAILGFMELNEQRLAESFYRLPTTELAKNLLGKVIVRRLRSGNELRGIIVEVEAYLAKGDPASHSHAGPGKKNASMFLGPGTLYVYPIHSRHCLNIVSEPTGQGAAVLVRALEPIAGVESMRQLRSLPEKAAGIQAMARLTRGPGRLCEALGVDRRLDGLDLINSRCFWLEEPPKFIEDMAWQPRQSCRIGLSKAQSRQLRWFVDGNYFVSGCARDHSAGRHWSFMVSEDG